MSDTNEQPEPHALGSAPGSIPTRAAGSGEASGQIIGRYKLLEELGEGGMGTVWLAQQSEPVKRQVALKIIKLGMDTREVVARFEVERQALALMDHPHIAKVLDAGATASGRPYFVMERVNGTPITTFCDQAKLSLRERLELFSSVCHAIQHAHQKGIIHRDVKPSNVLVALQDGVPQPKVIDFGIAKATSSELMHQSLLTKFAQVIGTPEYMAPEQTDGGGLDIDTRADVYSLGVLLYELLTGTKPFDIRQAITAGYEEMLRVIREVDPPKPSTRISSLGESADSIALKRRVDTQLLSKRLSGDLDWIVMKAIEKDRARRYETASGFADDIANYLGDEPVDAAPPSARYRLKKLLRRRKKTVLSLTVIALLLVAGSVGTGVGWWKTSRANKLLDTALDQKAAALAQEEAQRQLAEENEALARENEKRARLAESQALAEAGRANEAEARAQARADELEQVAAFQEAQLSELDVKLMGVRLREALLAAAPEAQRSDLVQQLAGINFTNLSLDSLRENMFARTVEAIDKQFALQPTVQAQLLQTTAATWRDLGLRELALDPQRRALSLRRQHLGDEHADTLGSMNSLAYLLAVLGKLSEAEPLYRVAVDGLRRVLGDEHPNTLVAINGQASLFRIQGKFAEAEPLLWEVLEARRRVLGDEHKQTIASMMGLGALFYSQAKFSEAESLIREAVQASRRTLGEEHRSTLGSVNALGLVLSGQGKLNEAMPFHREALEAMRRVQGDEHPDTLILINNMGHLLKAQGKFSEAEPLYREALDANRRILGDEHEDTLNVINNMAALLQAQGMLSEAEPLYIETLATRRRLLGNDHPDTLLSITNLANLLHDQGRHLESEPLILESSEATRRVLGLEHPYTWSRLSFRANTLQALGRFSESESAYREALDGSRSFLGDEHSTTLTSFEGFESLLREMLRDSRAAGEELKQGEALAKLGSLQFSRQKYKQAEALFGEALDLLFAEAPESDARPWHAQFNLARAIAGQGRFAEAEPILQESAKWLLEYGAALAALESGRAPKTAGEVLQALAHFEAAWHAAQPGNGHAGKAAEWQVELDAWTARQPAGGEK